MTSENEGGSVTPPRRLTQPGKSNRVHIPREVHGNTVYDKDIHPASIKEMSRKGMFIERFCAKHDICKKTFQNWQKDHPEFREAHELGMTWAEAHWAELPLQYMEKSFSYQYWASIMRLKFKFGQFDAKGLSEMTPAEIMKFALDQYGDGKINDVQLERLQSAALAKAKIEEHTTMKEDLELLKSKMGIVDNG